MVSDGWRPAVEVSDMMMDNLFLLKDGSYVVIDYESKYSEENKIKYLGYVARLMKRLYNRDKKVPVIQVAVIYTADVTEEQTRSVLDWEYGQISVKEAFLTSWDTEGILNDLDKKIRNRQDLSDEDKKKLIMVPLSVKGTPHKLDVFRKCIDLIKTLEEKQLQIMLCAGLVAFTDKIIGKEEFEEIRRILDMTKVGRIILDEQEAAVRNNSETIAKNLLLDGYPMESVSKNTGLDMSVVEQLAEQIKKEEQMKEPVSV